MENSDQYIILWQYGLNASWVLLPLVPAVLIYLIFPKSQTSIGGPFAGLTLKAGGAFAAYFIVLLATLPLLNRQNDNLETLLRPSWEITGTIQVEDENGNEINYDDQSGKPLRITMMPDLVRLLGAKRFRATVPEIDNEVPAIFIEYSGFGTYTIDPTRPQEGESVRIDTTKKLIEITSPLLIRRRPCQGPSCEPQP